MSRTPEEEYNNVSYYNHSAYDIAADDYRSARRGKRLHSLSMIVLGLATKAGMITAVVEHLPWYDISIICGLGGAAIGIAKGLRGERALEQSVNGGTMNACAEYQLRLADIYEQDPPEWAVNHAQVEGHEVPPELRLLTLGGEVV